MAISVTQAPTVSVNDVTIDEGHGGTVNMTFTVTLSGPSSQTVIVNFGTANNTAASGSDYNAAFGTLVFAPGETVKTITFR